MNSNNRAIIAAALATKTAAQARAVNELIAKDVGGRNQRPVGDRYNNFGLLTMSGSYEYKALEPVTNQQDAVLERLAFEKYGDLSLVPYSTPHEAALDLLKGLSYQDQADMVTVEFRESDPPTKSSKRLSIVYRDLGCGMTAAGLSSNMFRLGSSHKTERSWHQGAFGLGGASTFRNAQAVVVVTRRSPSMLTAEETDEISVAVVEWEVLGKNQSAVYLVTSPWSDGSNARAWSAPASDYPEFEPGTHLALVSYGVDGFQVERSGDEKAFDMALNTRLFNPVTPVRFVNEIARGKNEYLRGLQRRFADNPREDRQSDEEVLKYLHDNVVYDIPIRYYFFPAGDTGAKRRFVARNHALVFLSNGQVHHHWTPQQFRMKTTLNKMHDRIFVTIDTDGLPIELRTALFTPDRSQLIADSTAVELEAQVAEFLSTWPSLQKINGELIREAVEAAAHGKSTHEISRKISSALKVKGFGMAGAGNSGGNPGGNGGPRFRKTVETYQDPTAFEGPDSVHVVPGSIRYLTFMLNAVDDFFSSGRGEVTFKSSLPDVSLKKMTPGPLRGGYFRVALPVPNGAIEGDYVLTATIADWQKAAGGLGPELRWDTKVVVVDELPTGGKPGTGAGTKGPSDGGDVAMIRTEKWEGLDKSTPGLVDQLPASRVATFPGYEGLASLGEVAIPTIVLNEAYSPYKGYMAERAKTLTENAAQATADRYAVGTGLGLLLLNEDLRKREKNTGVAVDEEFERAARVAIARSVLVMMPYFDQLAKEAGAEEEVST